MIEIKLEFPYIKLETRDFGFLSAVKEHFSGFAPGYRFSPKYEAGVWDGKIYMLRDRKLPYGLLTDLLKLYKKDFSHIQLVLDPALGRVFNTPVKEATDLTSLKWPAAEHQIECIAAALPYGKGIIRAATGAGKSLIMAYIAKNYFDAKYIKKLLIVVPSKSLIAQLESDFVDYGINENLIGKVFSGAKEWDKKIVISTWQSLANNHDKLPAFDAIFIDECLDENTLITTPNGKIKIKDLKIGDKIISYNLKSNTFEEDNILKIHKNLQNSDSEKFYELTFDNNKTIKITGNHKILTTDGYIRADELTENHDIISLNL